MNIKLNNLFVSLRSAPWSYRILLGSITFILIAAFTPPPATATLFENVRIFNGFSEQLSAPANVLVVGNKIQTISQKRIPAPSRVRLTRIKGNGRTLMPGLIDVHTHLFLTIASLPELLSPDTPLPVLNKKSIIAAEEMLMRGFTSERDVGGPVFELKRAIDAGETIGPRIYPSGAMSSQTSGHGDYRNPATDFPSTATSPLSRSEELGITAIADGVPEVLRAVREQLMKGASLIKVFAGGGIASNYDPIDVTQYTEAELRAAVEAAEDWNTYVTVHAYTPRAVQKAIRAGVKCIEHGQLIDEETAQMIAKKDIWLSIQPFILNDEFPNPYPEGSVNYIKTQEVVEGTDLAYRLAKKYNIKTAFGTDTLFDSNLATKQGQQLVNLTKWYTPAETLKMATSTNAELLALSGLRNPYPGKLGVVQEGALADLILVNGNPIQNIQLIADPEKNFLIIMKDGKIYKNAF